MTDLAAARLIAAATLRSSVYWVEATTHQVAHQVRELEEELTRVYAETPPADSYLAQDMLCVFGWEPPS